MLAPVFLAVSVPGDALLYKFVCLGKGVRLDDESVLCLSGSAVFGGVLHALSDLDFCEHLRADANIGSLVDAKTISERPLFIRGRVDDRRFARPDVIEKSLRFAGVQVLQSIKLNYVGNAASGPMPVSNLSLVTPNALAHTWPFQEIVIGEAGPTEGLVQPARLGEYLLWLDEQIEEYLSNKPTKALKRALCLARICDSRFVDEALQSLNQAPIIRQCAEEALQEVTEMAALVSEDGAGVMQEVERARRALESADDLAAAAEECRRVAVAIREEFRESLELAQDLLN